ncbi:Intracellular membrane-bound Ca2-independent phospholipase A2 [Ceraceosorus bombacis]|uniref:Intracellular membrane-bound Ca2-independent phospholipase A2 n=1 Tax=Ceraceosorus bombacis TaxID=401625 RepID=A0A0P1BKN4_9BASI|nr:Intracellular membrane-bound Ca2-independent phospholipase A2 [Ceraceosorus bombacis]
MPVAADAIFEEAWISTEKCKVDPLVVQGMEQDAGAVALAVAGDSPTDGLDALKGSQTWFDIAILPSADSTEIKRSKSGREMVWTSHFNQISPDHSLNVPVRHFGTVFDRRADLLACLAEGDVLAIRVCARRRGSINTATRAFVTARLLSEDLFTPQNWTLTNSTIPKHEAEIKDGVYTFSATTSCLVRAEDSKVRSSIWMTSPALDRAAIDQLESVQLFTRSRFQRLPEEGVLPAIEAKDSFSWFDIVILDSPSATTPRIVNGVTLCWLSHQNVTNDFSRTGQAGQLFDIDEQEDVRCAEIQNIKSALREGNVLAVRVCAQYKGWENYAKDGKLVVRISNESKAAPAIPIPDYTQATETTKVLQQTVRKFYNAVEAQSDVVIQSQTTGALSNEIRADQVLTNPSPSAPPPSYSASLRPLRVLSLDGGGVRGVSELRSLKQIMDRVSAREGRKPDNPIHPHQWFDMIAGTSTGGLIAMMLGRLKLSIAQCEAAYDKISKQVFQYKAGWIKYNEGVAFAMGSYMYDADKLADAVREIAGEFGIEKDREMKLRDENNTTDTEECKVVVLTCRANPTDDGKMGVHLRSYVSHPNVPDLYKDFTLWQAARATSAAPVYFERLKVGDDEFIDGGMGFNNPVLELFTEMNHVYGPARPIEAVISLGTGVPKDLRFSKTGVSTTIKEVIGMLTNSETAHKAAEDIVPRFALLGKEKYWRFNLSKALSDGDVVGNGQKYEELMTLMDDWSAIPLIRQLTDKWLAHPETVQMLERCVASFSDGEKTDLVPPSVALAKSHH